jgi:hypothetical protein
VDNSKVACALRGIVLYLLALLIALPFVADAAPRKVTKELADQLFRSPATPRDTALAQTVKDRLRAMGAAGSKTTATSPRTAPASGAYTSPDWWVNVTVDARSGHVRLGGRNLTPAQRTAVESAMNGMPDVGSYDWGD